MTVVPFQDHFVFCIMLCMVAKIYCIFAVLFHSVFNCILYRFIHIFVLGYIVHEDIYIQGVFIWSIYVVFKKLMDGMGDKWESAHT